MFIYNAGIYYLLVAYIFYAVANSDRIMASWIIFGEIVLRKRDITDWTADSTGQIWRTGSA